MVNVSNVLNSKQNKHFQIKKKLTLNFYYNLSSSKNIKEYKL